MGSHPGWKWKRKGGANRRNKYERVYGMTPVIEKTVAREPGVVQLYPLNRDLFLDKNGKGTLPRNIEKISASHNIDKKLSIKLRKRLNRFRELLQAVDNLSFSGCHTEHLGLHRCLMQVCAFLTEHTAEFPGRQLFLSS